MATPLSAPFVKSGLEVQTTEQAADRLLDTIDRLRLDSSGGFFDHHGEAVRGDNSAERCLTADPAPLATRLTLFSMDSRCFSLRVARRSVAGRCTQALAVQPLVAI